jgi:hypothetical protein
MKLSKRFSLCFTSEQFKCQSRMLTLWIVHSVSLTFIKSFYILSSNVWFSDVPDKENENDTTAMSYNYQAIIFFFSFQLKYLFEIFTFVSERNIKYQYLILTSLILIACNRNSVSRFSTIQYGCCVPILQLLII